MTNDEKDALMTQRKRIPWKEGDVVAIDLGDGQMSFGRVLERPLIAFYDLKAEKPPPVDEIVRRPVLFKVWVMQYAIKKGVWPIIGHLPLEKALQETPLFFKQDPITSRLYIYQDSGRDIPATLEQVEGLECAAAWDPEHVVERLQDHFAGQPYRYADLFRPKPVLSEEEQQKIRRALDAKYKNLTAKKRARPAKRKTAKPAPKRGKR
jgi:hypothetical protein